MVGTSELGLIQRKLQRAYQEKEMLIVELNSLKQQLRDSKSNPHESSISSSSKESWDTLLESNLRTGTRCAVMCLKIHVIKSMARAFNRWKYCNVNVSILSKPHSKHVEHRIKDVNDRRSNLLQAAHGILTRNNSQSPSAFKNSGTLNGLGITSSGTRRSSKNPHYREQTRKAPQSFDHKSNKENSSSVMNRSVSVSAPSTLRGYAQDTYSSLKMQLDDDNVPSRSAYKSYLAKKKSRRSQSASPTLQREKNVKPQSRSTSTIERRDIFTLGREQAILAGIEEGLRDRTVQTNEDAILDVHRELHLLSDALKPIMPERSKSSHGVDDVSEISADFDSRVPGVPNRNDAVQPQPASFLKNIAHQREIQAQLVRKRQQNSNAKSQSLRGMPRNSSMDKAQLMLLYGSLETFQRKGQNSNWSTSLRSK